MKLTETRWWDQMIRDAVEHRTLRGIYYEAGYRAGRADVANEERSNEKKDSQK